MSAANFGNCPTPVSEAVFTRNGGRISVYPCSPRVHIQKEIRKRPLQPRAQSLVNREPRPRDFHRRVKIQNSRALANLPVRTRREIKRLAARPIAALPHCPRRHLPTGTLACGIFGTVKQKIASSARPAP